MTSTVVVTGAGGFLGWHVRVAAQASGLPAIPIGRKGLKDQPLLVAAIDGAERVVHLAGMPRGRDDEVWSGNLGAADALARALHACVSPPKVVVFANSVHAGDGTVSGDAKAAAAELLADATRWVGSAFVDERLPHVFGEHGRPHYNSVVATFCQVLADGGTPEVYEDSELSLLHATDAAARLLGQEPTAPAVRRTVRQIEERLRYFATTCRSGAIPELADRFDVRLFNTYRSHCFPAHYPMPLARYGDARGELVEAARIHGGTGQTFCSYTHPGVTRGEHYHLARVERFVVVSGDADICLRRLFSDKVIRFRANGREPVAIDIPTMWTHNITNVGDADLVTLLWSNENHPARPDTYPETVLPA